MPLPQWRVLWLNLIVEGFHDTYSLHKHFTIHSFKSRILLKLEFKPQHQPISSKITCISFERKFGNCFVSDCSTAATRWQRLSFWWPQCCSKSRCDGKLRQQGGVDPLPLNSAEEKLKIREQREGFLSAAATLTTLLLSCTEAVTVGVRATRQAILVVWCESIPNHITFAGSISTWGGHSAIYSILFLALGANRHKEQ